MLPALIILGGLGAGAYVMTSVPVKDFKRDKTNMLSKYSTNLRDNAEVGISWGTVRTQDLNLCNLNEAWKPRSAPTQKSTRNITDIFRDQADVNAYLEQFGPDFYLRQNGELPMTSAQQSNLNIEIPSVFSSFRGDPNNSLLNYPRVYVDYDESTHGYPNREYICDDRNFYGAGQPETREVCKVPEEGRNNILMNPFGPGGKLQKLVNRFNEKQTEYYGADRSRIIRPPMSGFKFR